MSDTHDSRRGSKLSRRFFVSSALLSTTPLLVTPSANAQSPLVAEPVLSLPKPADAITDFLLLTREIERYLLHRYYIIIGNISRDLSTQYAELRTAVKKLLELAPQLGNGVTSTNLKENTDVALASLVRIQSLLNERVPIGEQMAIVKISSKSLEDFARDSQTATGPLTLSAAAVEKLKEIIRRINGLGQPITNLKDASDALSATAIAIRDITRPVETDLAMAIKYLVKSELAELPPSPNGQQPNRMLAERQRRLAAEFVVKASNSLAAFETFVIPAKLRVYETKANLTTAELDRLRMSEGVTAKSIKESLDGCVDWINEGSFFRQTRGLGDGPGIIRVASYAPQGWFGSGTWQAIRGLLGSQIPQATTTRTAQLWWRKRCVRRYPALKQQEIFYNLLPELNPPNDVDFSKDNTKRVDAAKKLAEMQWI